MDLFQNTTSLPIEVQKVIEKFNDEQLGFLECSVFAQELKVLGYTFDWDLDAIPYNLKKIEENDEDSEILLKFEEYKGFSSKLFDNEEWAELDAFTAGYKLKN